MLGVIGGTNSDVASRIDVMFTTRPQLLAVWPDVVRHAALNMSSEDVLGFLGRKLHPSLAAQVVTDAKRRPQGWRVRHRMAGNWVKVCDKASVLRVETTINNPREFRIQRLVTNEHGRRERRWCPMRKGVSDLWRNFQVGIAANHRYLDALAAAPLKGEGVAALDTLSGPAPTAGEDTPASTHCTLPTSPCSAQRWPASTPSKASATSTSPTASTAAHPSTATRPTDDANGSPA